MERRSPAITNYIKHGKLTDQELYHVLRELRRYKTKAETAGLYSSAKGKYVNPNSRLAKVCWATTDIAPFSFNILQSHVIEQYSGCLIDTTDIAEIQYTSYRKDGIFTWHSDNIPNHRSDKKVRGITMSVNLTDPSNYTGGDLLVRHEEHNDEISLCKERGSYIMFPSYLKHQACRVESGVREALVVWTYLTNEELDWFRKNA